MLQIFEVIPQVNKERKRMINVEFVSKQLFKMLKLPHYFIPISKSKKTIKYNKKYWDDIMFWKGDQIHEVYLNFLSYCFSNLSTSGHSSMIISSIIFISKIN